jgi:cytochrome c556
MEKQGEKDPAKWKKWTEEMGKSALELAKEIKAGDAMKVKAAATTLDNSCKNCHGVFRDS